MKISRKNSKQRSKKFKKVVKRLAAYSAAAAATFMTSQGMVNAQEKIWDITDLTWTGLDFSAAAFGDIMTVDPQAAMQEADAQRALFDDFGDRLPAELEAQRQDLKARLGK